MKLKLNRLAPVLMAVALSSGCWREQEPKKLVLVAFDTSATASNEDWSLYRAAFDQLIAPEGDLRAGDRVVVTTISSTTLTRFVPLVDVAFADTGIALDDGDDAELKRLELKAAIEKLENELRDSPQTKARNTLILDAAQLAEQVFRNNPARTSKHFVLFSDMLEESADGNFRLRPPSEQASADLIARLRKAGRVPDLTGVRVQVLGARAPSSTAMLLVEGFWRKFFAETGAELRPGDYSRAAAVARLR